MSFWLSAANRVAGTVRGHATAQVKREVNTAITQASRENLKLWSDAMKPSATRTRRKR